MENIIDELYQEVENLQIDWSVNGLIDANESIYSLGHDTKLIGRIFEILVAPAVKTYAEKHDLKYEIPSKQNIYPDFTLSKSNGRRIAIDVKTTYLQKNLSGENRSFQYTLGSFNSFLRDNTKNIHYPYDQYDIHLVIGFLYERNPESKEGIIVNGVKHLQELPSPVKNVQYFIQHKYKISGDKPGSGNTENIGSIKSNDLLHFKQGKGPFSELGESVFEDYWRNYPRYRTSEKRKYTDLESYFKYKGQ
ncbi:type II restriction endonuclease [Savagea faecisuis]|uniref:Type II restriction endonuclease n=1 Tax=Savagea faecisuis TaxID=1274803 RepID=A0ABW3GZT4_9BACL